MSLTYGFERYADFHMRIDGSRPDTLILPLDSFVVALDTFFKEKAGWSGEVGARPAGEKIGNPPLRPGLQGRG